MVDDLTKNNRQVARWLLAGVIMILIQIVLGGITRLTESGLSITEWEPIKGVLPPLNETAWQEAFLKYQQTDQYKYLHQRFTLSDFKFIYFWEWFHRLWARFMGLVFIVGFIYFLVTKKFNRSMVMPMVILFLLGALQGTLGWIMVKSGLVPEKYFVGHIELTTHLVAAFILMVYVFWFAMKLMPQFQTPIANPALKSWLNILIALVFIQLVYGGFMAGLRAAQSAPTWPTINGAWIPGELNELSPWARNLFDNNIMVQFIHRGLAYLILLLTIYVFVKGKRVPYSLYQQYNYALVILMIVQVLLGIFTVLNATLPQHFLWLGVTHQFVAMLLLLALTGLRYMVKEKSSALTSVQKMLIMQGKPLGCNPCTRNLNFQ